MPKRQPNTATDTRQGARVVPSLETFNELMRVDPLSLSAGERVRHLQDVEAHAAWFELVRLQAVAAVAGPDPDAAEAECACADAPAEPDGDVRFPVHELVRDEVAAALRLSPMAAQRRIDVARGVVHRLPETRQLLGAGVCTAAHAAVIVDETSRLDVSVARQVEKLSLSRVGSQTPTQTRRAVRRAALRLAPVAPVEVLEEEFARRDVQLWHDGGVMATLAVTLPVPDALVVFNTLNACAHAVTPSVDGEGRQDTRTIAHKRADALVAWANQAATHPDLPVVQGKKRLEVQVVIDLDTLMGLTNEPGEFVGVGPIPATLARQLAAESDQWRRLVTDPVTGHLLDYGTTTYTPPAVLREYVIARDRTCQFPSCSRAAYRCDLDHATAWTGTSSGGYTSAANLTALCRRHHQLKTHHKWKTEQVTASGDDPPGTVWTSPTGTTYTRAKPQPGPPAAARHTALERALHHGINRYRE